MIAIKKTLVGIVITGAAMLMPGQAANAQGIPVFDNSNTFQNIAQVTNQVEQLINDARDLENQIRQLTNLEDQLDAITGGRNLGDLGNGLPQYENRRYIPGTVSGIYDLGAGEGTGPAAVVVDELEQEFSPEPAEEIFGTDALDTPVARSYQRHKQVVYASNAASAVALNNYEDQVINIESMLQELNTSQDLKASTDLAARISAEQALIQAHLASLTAIQIQLMTAQEQQRIAGEQLSLIHI